jgi:hypothetical protein
VTLGIMQPYFLPYIGYWQLLASVDRFIVYDNIQYTKKGWINRNRFLQHGQDAFLTIPLKHASDFLEVRERSLADDFDRRKLLGRLESSYRKAPSFGAVFPVLEEIVSADLSNLFDYLYNSIRVTAGFLGIATPVVVSSSVGIDHELRAERKVIALCKALNADRYVNPVGGQELYSKPVFLEHGITLEFIQARPIRYRQFVEPFVPSLSILDVMMFNSRDAVRAMLREYDLV